MSEFQPEKKKHFTLSFSCEILPGILLPELYEDVEDTPEGRGVPMGEFGHHPTATEFKLMYAVMKARQGRKT